MAIKLRKFIRLSPIEQNLIIGLARRYYHKHETRKVVYDHYSDALKIVNRHEPGTAEVCVSRLLERFNHILAYPSSAFTHGANEFWSAGKDAEEFVRNYKGLPKYKMT